MEVAEDKTAQEPLSMSSILGGIVQLKAKDGESLSDCLDHELTDRYSLLREKLQASQGRDCLSKIPSFLKKSSGQGSHLVSASMSL